MRHTPAPVHPLDSRVRRTRDWIVKSMHGLVLSRPFDDIPVSEIARNAGVGRSTFYEHFRGKDELLRHVMAVLLEVLADAATDEGDAARIERIVAHFREHRAAALAMLNGPSSAQITHHLADLIETRLARLCRERRARLIIPIRLAAEQASGSQLSLIGAWLERAVEPCPPSAIAEAIRLSVRGTVSSLLATNA